MLWCCIFLVFHVNSIPCVLYQGYIWSIHDVRDVVKPFFYFTFNNYSTCVSLREPLCFAPNATQPNPLYIYFFWVSWSEVVVYYRFVFLLLLLLVLKKSLISARLCVTFLYTWFLSCLIFTSGQFNVLPTGRSFIRFTNFVLGSFCFSV